MKAVQNVWFITLLLSSIAGYCDTATFVAADHIFSAHVTGNFIVFAYQLVNHADASSWVKLITLPVFIISVISGGWIASKSSGLRKAEPEKKPGYRRRVFSRLSAGRHSG